MALLLPASSRKPGLRPNEGNKVGCPDLPAWPTGRSKFWPFLDHILVRFWLILPISWDFGKCITFFYQINLKIQLSAPKYIGIATKNAFLGLKMPELGLSWQIVPLALFWRFGVQYWRQIGSRWRHILGHLPKDVY